MAAGGWGEMLTPFSSFPEISPESWPPSCNKDRFITLLIVCVISLISFYLQWPLGLSSHSQALSSLRGCRGPLTVEPTGMESLGLLKVDAVSRC